MLKVALKEEKKHFHVFSLGPLFLAGPRVVKTSDFHLFLPLIAWKLESVEDLHTLKCVSR